MKPLVTGFIENGVIYNVHSIYNYTIKLGLLTKSRSRWYVFFEIPIKWSFNEIITEWSPQHFAVVLTDVLSWRG